MTKMTESAKADHVNEEEEEKNEKKEQKEEEEEESSRRRRIRMKAVCARVFEELEVLYGPPPPAMSGMQAQGGEYRPTPEIQLEINKVKRADDSVTTSRVRQPTVELSAWQKAHKAADSYLTEVAMSKDAWKVGLSMLDLKSQCFNGRNESLRPEAALFAAKCLHFSVLHHFEELHLRGRAEDAVTKEADNSTKTPQRVAGLAGPSYAFHTLLSLLDDLSSLPRRFVSTRTMLARAAAAAGAKGKLPDVVERTLGALASARKTKLKSDANAKAKEAEDDSKKKNNEAREGDGDGEEEEPNEEEGALIRQLAMETSALEILSMLPEQPYDLHFDDADIYQFLNSLTDDSPLVYRFMGSLALRKEWSGAHPRAFLIRIFADWISKINPPPNPKDLDHHPIFAMAMDAIQEKREELVVIRAAGRLLTDVMTRFDCMDGEAQDLVHSVASAISAARPIFRELCQKDQHRRNRRVVDGSTEDTFEHVLVLAHLLVDLGEKWYELVLAAGSLSLSVVSNVMTVMEQRDPRVAYLALHFWFTLAQALCHPDHESQKYIFRAYYLKLIDEILRLCQLPPSGDISRVAFQPLEMAATNRTNIEDAAVGFKSGEGVEEVGQPIHADDDPRSFRYQIVCYLHDSVRVIGSYLVLKKLAETLNDNIAKYSHTRASMGDQEWHVLESLLFGLRFIVDFVDPDEESAIQDVVRVLPDLPREPNIMYMRSLLLGHYASWLRQHPQLLADPIFPMLLDGFNFPGPARASASALKEICKQCAFEIPVEAFKHWDQSVAASMAEALSITEELQVLYALVEASSKFPADEHEEASSRVLQPILGELARVRQRRRPSQDDREEDGGGGAPREGEDADRAAEVEDTEAKATVERVEKALLRLGSVLRAVRANTLQGSKHRLAFADASRDLVWETLVGSDGLVESVIENPTRLGSLYMLRLKESFELGKELDHPPSVHLVERLARALIHNGLCARPLDEASDWFLLKFGDLVSWFRDQPKHADEHRSALASALVYALPEMNRWAPLNDEWDPDRPRSMLQARVSGRFVGAWAELLKTAPALAVQDRDLVHKALGMGYRVLVHTIDLEGHKIALEAFDTFLELSEESTTERNTSREAATRVIDYAKTFGSIILSSTLRAKSRIPNPEDKHVKAADVLWKLFKICRRGSIEPNIAMQNWSRWFTDAAEESMRFAGVNWREPTLHTSEFAKSVILAGGDGKSNAEEDRFRGEISRFTKLCRKAIMEAEGQYSFGPND